MREKYHNSSPTPNRVERTAAVRSRLQRAHWNLLPLVVAVCGWCTTLLLCRVMLSRETAQVAQTAALATRNIQNKITSSISTQVAPLEALVARWGADPDPWQPEWESEATQLHQMYPALESINLVDVSYMRRWGAPSIQSQLPSLRPAIDATRRSRQTMVVPATGTAGDKSFVVLIPMFRHGQFNGCVIAPLRTEQWLNSILDTEIPKGYSASISHREEQVYTRAATGASHELVYLSEGRITFYGMPWVVRVWPTLDTWTELRHTLLALSLLIGLLIYMSGALAVVARRKTRAVERAKLRMAVHQENLRHANLRMGTVIQASPLAIVVMDLASQ
ncbi:MAG TPA: hypothetical protein VFO27_06695, partial [Bryobacteraceae bacterium]|nr:hypothetical protein [Bryobacteraceae bacterium]